MCKGVKRELTINEKKLIKNMIYEEKLNESIKKLINRVNGLYIPELTNLYGNCCFEALKINGVIDDVKRFRKDLAYFMYIFRDYKNLLYNEESSLKELFYMYNEIEHVIDNNATLYVYNYDMMCKDLSINYSWERLPTELILLVISLLLEIKIIIYYDDSNFVHTISAKKEFEHEVYLGHINGCHYVALIKNMDEDKKDVIYYDYYKIKVQKMLKKKL
jgi:hypothetical protein